MQLYYSVVFSLLYTSEILWPPTMVHNQLAMAVAVLSLCCLHTMQGVFM